MLVENARADRRPGLEETGSNCRRLESDHRCDFRRIVSLKIDEVEDFPLARGQLPEEMPDVIGNTLPVYACAGVGQINRVSAWNCGVRKPSPAACLAVPLKGDAACDEVHPPLEGRVAAKLIELPMHEHESILGDLIGFIYVARKGERPPEDDLVENSDQIGECPDIAEPGLMDKLSDTHISERS